jgi:HK97 gp10 family phage protein
MAGKTGITVRIVSNRLPAISAAIRPAVSAEVKKAALDVEALAKARVPVKTATLQRSIHTVFPTDLSAIVGPSVFYGLFVEMGTRRMGARPYMRPAAEAVLPKFAGTIKALLGKL